MKILVYTYSIPAVSMGVADVLIGPVVPQKSLEWFKEEEGIVGLQQLGRNGGTASHVRHYQGVPHVCNRMMFEILSPHTHTNTHTHKKWIIFVHTCILYFFFFKEDILPQPNRKLNPYQ